jgi:hypothetical protein
MFGVVEPNLFSELGMVQFYTRLAVAEIVCDLKKSGCKDLTPTSKQY